MPDNHIGFNVFGSGEDDKFIQGPVTDVTPKPKKDELLPRETDGHFLDDLLKTQHADRIDKTKEDLPKDSAIGFAIMVLFLIAAAIVVFSILF